jgi:hypothetical protein
VSWRWLTRAEFVLGSVEILRLVVIINANLDVPEIVVCWSCAQIDMTAINQIDRTRDPLCGCATNGTAEVLGLGAGRKCSNKSERKPHVAT